jgi:hypothetical protein
MQLGSGSVSAPISGPIPRDERTLRHQELFEMVCHMGGGGGGGGGGDPLPSSRASPAKAKQVAICAQPQLN